MPSKSSKSSSSSGCGCRCFSFKTLSFLAIFLALFSAVYRFLDARLEQFYIFDPEHLHDVSQRAISAHGEDTRSIVNFIVAELEQKVGPNYLSTQEEWVFNNAGGAMGAMYVIHASITEYLIVFGKLRPTTPITPSSNSLTIPRYRRRHRGPHWPPHRR